MTQTVFDFIRDHSTVAALVVLVGGIICWHAWDFRIRPLFIPKPEIDVIVDELIAEHGPRAEEMAFIGEDRAWRYSDVFAQGKWRRVRRELRRRHKRANDD